MKSEHMPRVVTRITHVPGAVHDGLAALADALLLTSGTVELDRALKVAHTFNSATAHRQMRRRALEYAAATLQHQLAHLTDEMEKAA